MKKILILAANPKDTSNLRLEEEVREIEKALQQSPNRNDFQIITESAVQVDDLIRFLFYHQPKIVHFAGHASGADGLVLEDNSGQIQLLSTEALAKLFDLFEHIVECVLLNACYSEEQATAIHQHIDYVIGMNKAIGDKAAIKFSVGFYTALWSGMSYEDCFGMGCDSIVLQGIPEHLIPVMRFRRRDQGEQSINPVFKNNSVNANISINKDSNNISGEKDTLPKTHTSLVRYPCLHYPDITILNQQFKLLVQLLLKQPESTAQHILVEDDGDLDSLPKIEVVIRTAGRFDIKGDDYQLMQVKRDEDSSVEFILTPLKLGKQDIRVDFYQYDRRIHTERFSLIVKESSQPQKKTSYSQQSISLEINTVAIAPPPDLEICVEIHNQRTLNFSIHSSSRVVNYHHTKVGQVDLQGLPLDKMQSVYQELSSKAARFSRDSSNRKGTSVKKDEYGNIERQFAVLGCQLWDELIPEKLKQEYWRFKSYVKSMLITSDEPWVPWEMIKPYRYDEDGNRQDEPFWCQQFALSRWLSGQGSMVEKLPIGITASVAPTQINLPAVQQELEFINHLPDLRSGIVVLKPSSGCQEILNSLEKEKFSILHFACHGMFDATLPNNSGISLSDGFLRPADVLVRFGGKRPRPLVFINACHGARSSFSFTGLGGWAQRLILEAHVGAFIGAMWEVNDELALKFAQQFYTRLLKNNETIAEAFRQAREEIRRLAPYNSTWLAYSLYADPEGHFQDKLEIENLNQEEVIQKLEQIEQLILAAELPEGTKKKSLRYLKTAKDEVLETEPDKEFAASNLKRMVDTLRNGSETVSSIQILWKNARLILLQLCNWLDVTEIFF